MRACVCVCARNTFSLQQQHRSGCVSVKIVRRRRKEREEENSGRSRADFFLLNFPASRGSGGHFHGIGTAPGAAEWPHPRGQNVPADTEKKKNLDDDQQSVGATRRRTRRSPLSLRRVCLCE